MGDDNTAAATMVDGSNNERMLSSSLSKDYNYSRNYIAIIEPKNFVTVFPNGGGIVETTLDTFFDEIPPSLQGSSTILNGT